MNYHKGDANSTRTANDSQNCDVLHRLFCSASLHHYLTRGDLFKGTLDLPFTNKHRSYRAQLATASPALTADSYVKLTFSPGYVIMSPENKDTAVTKGCSLLSLAQVLLPPTQRIAPRRRISISSFSGRRKGVLSCDAEPVRYNVFPDIV